MKIIRFPPTPQQLADSEYFKANIQKAKESMAWFDDTARSFWPHDSQGKRITDLTKLKLIAD